jgi:hypothetical protein
VFALILHGFCVASVFVQHGFCMGVAWDLHGSAIYDVITCMGQLCTM